MIKKIHSKTKNYILLLLVFFSNSFTESFDDAVKFKITLDKPSYKAGENLVIHFDITMKKKFHIYSTNDKYSLRPTVVEFYDSIMFDYYGEFLEPEPKIKYDANFEMDVGIHQNKFRLSKQLNASKQLKSGEHVIEGTLVYLACDPTLCIPRWDDFNFILNIEEGIYTPTPVITPIQENTMVDNAISEGISSFILLAITMGFLALLTPCVFPMIPITVAFFTKMGESQGSSPFKSATIYTLGIITIFTTLGLILAATLGATGANQIAANPWINIFIGALFVYFAFSLFGQYEIEMPAALRQFSMKQEQRGGIIGIIFMAFTFTLTSFTCTVQFVGLLLVAAFKFFSNTDLVWQIGFFTKPMVLACWTVIAILMGIYLLGKIQLPHDTKLENISVPRLIMSIACLSFGLYLSTGLFGQKLHGLIDSYLPPDFSYIDNTNSTPTSNHEKLVWYEDFEEGLEKSKISKKPIFIDFTGYTCTNCRWMEMNVFEDPSVIQLFKKYTLIRLYTDGGPNARKNQQMEVNRFGTAALPYYVILTYDNIEISRFAGTDTDVNKFINFLKKGLS